MRATVWLLTVALIIPMFMLGNGPARAQAASSLTVLVADFVDLKANSTRTPLAIAARDAIYNELVASGQWRFNPIPEKEVRTEAKTLGLRVPARDSEPADFSAADLTRLARALNADAIVNGRVNAVAAVRGRASTVVMEVTITDATSGDPINGGQKQLSAALRPGQSLTAQETQDKAVSDAALEVTRQMVARQIVTATVLNINQDVVLLNRGTRDGLKAGDDLNIIRERAGQKVNVGKVRIARAYATDAEADVEQNVGGIQPEDFARVIYRPEFTFDLKTNAKQENVRNTRVNFSAIGRTLTALGLGVLIAVAIKGGQASTTNVVAEPTEDGDNSSVRVTWQDNIFGQAGVVEYHIYRDGDTTPNFAPGTPFSTSSTDTTTTTTTTVISGVPIGTSTPTIHQYLDRPSPYYPYSETGGYVIASSNGSNATSQSSSSSTSSTSSGCGVQTIAVDTGFTAGHTYKYYVTAIILRTQPVTSAGSSSSSTSSSSTSTGTSSSSSGTGTTCLETDPVAGGYATPIVPVLPTSPANLTTLDFSTFNPTWPSRNGADIFQIEVSTDRTFHNQAVIYHTEIFSSAPTQAGVQQALPGTVNLLASAQLLADPTFNAFVNPKTGVTSTTPTLYYRIGARHDSDTPGPEDWITTQPSAASRTFRWVYGRIYQIQPTPLPPNPPGKAVTKSAASATRTGKATTSKLTATRATTRTTVRTAVQLSSAEDILTGRTRH